MVQLKAARRPWRQGNAPKYLVHHPVRLVYPSKPTIEYLTVAARITATEPRPALIRPSFVISGPLSSSKRVYDYKCHAPCLCITDA